MLRFFFTHFHFPLRDLWFYEDPDHFILQNIEEGKTYNLVMYVRSLEPVELTASLTCSRPSHALENLALASIQYVSFPQHGNIFEFVLFSLLNDVIAC